MIVNDPEVLAEVAEAVDGYETALMDNDLEALDAWFWNSPLTVRYKIIRVGGQKKDENGAGDVTF